MTALSQISEAMRALVEKTARHVVAINASDRTAASGILWRNRSDAVAIGIRRGLVLL